MYLSIWSSFHSLHLPFIIECNLFMNPSSLIYYRHSICRLNVQHLQNKWPSCIVLWHLMIYNELTYVSQLPIFRSLIYDAAASHLATFKLPNITFLQNFSCNSLSFCFPFSIITWRLISFILCPLVLPHLFLRETFTVSLSIDLAIFQFDINNSNYMYLDLLYTD